MSSLAFTKMQGCGNDFILVDAIESLPSQGLPELSREINDRRYGVGGDGLILVLRGDNAPFRMRMFNPDGSEAEMCGNGIRCFAKYVRERGLIEGGAVPVETGAGLLNLEFVDDLVRVNMGKARILRGEIPMAGAAQETAAAFQIDIDSQTFTATAVSMGNPHCVVFLDDVAAVPLEDWGPQVETNKLFPNRTNVHFAQVVSPTEIIQRTWERGAGATLACGTGACAVAVAGALNGKTERTATVHLPGGDLKIEYTEDGTVFMSGPAEFVFDGRFG